jgi:hypothetical protein
MPSPRRLFTPATAALTAFALSLSLLPAPAAAAPAGKGTVLTLEGDDPARAVGLTRALQAEFATRGVGGGREMSLSELKLTMGCDEPPAPKCLADGGKSLGIDTMVYGSLFKRQGGYTVVLSLLEVGTANVQKTITSEISKEDVEQGNVQATAKSLAAKLLGPDKVTPEPGPGPGPGPGEPSEPEGPTEPEQPSSKSKLVWGKHEDVAGWKKAGLYASAGLTVVSFGAAIGLFFSFRKPNGPVYKKLIDLAKASHGDDGNDDNNVQYWDGAKVCEDARSSLGSGVKNAAVADQCSRGENMAKATTGLLVAGGIFAAATLAFTTLMFVRREKPGMAKLRQRGFNLGAAPTLTGGVMVGGGMRF